MKFVLKWLGRLLLLVIAAGAGLWFLGPKEPVGLDVTFDAAVLNGGVQAYFDTRKRPTLTLSTVRINV